MNKKLNLIKLKKKYLKKFNKKKAINIANYYIIENKTINLYDYSVNINKKIINYIRSDVILDKLVIEIKNQTIKKNRGFYSQIIKKTNSNNLINTLALEEQYCLSKFINQINKYDLLYNTTRKLKNGTCYDPDYSYLKYYGFNPINGIDDLYYRFLKQFNLPDDSFKVREFLDTNFEDNHLTFSNPQDLDLLKNQFHKVFHPTPLGNFFYHPTLSLKINHTGEHLKQIDTSNYMITLAHKLNKINFENVEFNRIDLAIDITINSNENDFIQHFIYAYLIKRVHIPVLRKDKINFINFNSTINDVSNLDVSHFRKAGNLIDPFIIENKNMINNLSLITGFYIGNIKSRYHNSSLCVYYKHIQEGTLKKKIRFELRFKNKKATNIYFEIMKKLKNGLNYTEVTNSIFHREFRLLVSVKKYPKVHKKLIEDPRNIRENKQLYKVKKEALWFIQLCDLFKGGHIIE